MSDDTIRMAGILLITVPTIALGGAALLTMIGRRDPGYMDNEVRQNLFRAGHAHAGVLVLLALVGQLYVDEASLSEGWEAVARYGLVAAPILMPLGFFLSVASPNAMQPNRLILLTGLGGVSLSVAALTLGIGLVSAL